MVIKRAVENVKTIGIVGTGKIGAAWAAHFLAQGLDVIATDPSTDAENKLRTAVDNAWPSLEQLGLARNASRDRLRFSTSIDTSLSQVDFVQESTPEHEKIKDAVIVAISQVVHPNVVIASSTSGIIPTRLQAQCKHPDRLVVGHPFNPVHLIPLVEVVGGEHTAAEAIDWTMAFYRQWGKTPLHCRFETPGHIANRIQDAVLSEAMQLVVDGVATPAELDAALTNGPGLRWALMGSFVTAHMASEGGIRDMLNGKFGSSYHSYFQGPQRISDKTKMAIVENALSQTSGHSLDTMEKMRDEFLVGLLKLRADIDARYGFNQGAFDKTKYTNTHIGEI